MESFAEKLGRHSEREGFRLVVAYEGGEIVGFAYGFDGGEGGWTWGVIEPLLSEGEIEAWLSDYFEFVDFAVSPDARGRGVGGRLHDELLRGLPHRTSALFAFVEVEHPVSVMGLGRGAG